MNKNGWINIKIYGKPYERGYQYGQQCSTLFRNIQKMCQFVILDNYGVTWNEMIQSIYNDFNNMLRKEYPEFIQEIEGIVDGINSSNLVQTTFSELLAWNLWCSIPYWWSGPSKHSNSSSHHPKEGGSTNKFIIDKCSAFIACGKDWTKTGEIICAHNSFTDFIDGQYSNIILMVIPTNGYTFVMQTSPGWIWSGTDFFVTSSGIIGTETTFGGFQVYRKNHPIAFRIRYAMQYATTIDDYYYILIQNNGGDYANAWLFGDINTNEIAKIELGLDYHQYNKTKNGYFIGFNAPYNNQIRNLECSNSGFYDIRRHQGARYVRLYQLMQKYKGKINIPIARKIISDHYDVYLNKLNHPCSRTICSHYELDAREYMSQSDRPKPYQPRGAIDGILCSSSSAKQLKFFGKFGSSCSIPFYAKPFFQKHLQYRRYQHYIYDRPNQPWTILPHLK